MFKMLSLTSRGRSLPNFPAVYSIHIYKEKAPLATELGPLYHGQRMFQAYLVRRPLQSEAEADKVAEFPGAVVGRGIVVNVVLVNVSADKKLILALCPAHRRFIVDPVGLFWGHFPLGKGLAELIAQCTPLRRPACFRLILTLYQHKFGVGRFRVAEVEGHRPQLLRAQAIVKAVFQTSNDCPLGSLFVALDVGCGRRCSSFL